MCYLYFIFISHLSHNIPSPACCSKVQPSSSNLWYFIFSLLECVLTFEKAVTLILKHATFLRISNVPESALIYAELDYQKANIDVAIQQHLMAHASEHSVELFAEFIMGTDIGLFILPFVTCISDHLFSASTKASTNIEWLKHFLKPHLMKSLFTDS